MTNDTAITEILRDWNSGETDAKEQLLPYVYDELKRQARYYMSRERIDHTLQPTALVHEMFMRISQQSGIDWQNRSHFYGVSANLMRQILVDHARRHAAAKRGGATIHFSLDDLQVPVDQRASSIIALHEALEKLAEHDEMQSNVVEMKFFGGLTNSEIAEALEVSERTIGREWRSAKLWLFREINESS